MRQRDIDRIHRRYAATRDTFGPWEFSSGAYGTFAYCERVAHDYTLRLSIGDDDQPLDWGDCEPSDRERDAASAFYVALQVLDSAGEEVHHDGIGGVDAIDLPGYAQRTWEDAAAYALHEYLIGEGVRFAETETREAAHWAARDTITV
jgi:hypothetical protein